MEKNKMALGTCSSVDGIEMGAMKMVTSLNPK